MSLLGSMSRCKWKNRTIRWGIYTLLIVSVGLSPIFISTIWGAEETKVSIRIEGSIATVYDGEFDVTSCTIKDTSGVDHELSGVAACALVAAGLEAGFDFDFQDFGFGLFLSRIAGDSTSADYSTTWSFWINDDPASVGLDAQKVNEGDRILLAYGGYPAIPLRVQVAKQVLIDDETQVQVEQQIGEYDENFNWHGQWLAVEGADLHVGDTAYTTDQNGAVLVRLDKIGDWVIWATKEGTVRSPKYSISVVESPSPSPTPTLELSPETTPTVTQSPEPSFSPTLSPTPTPTPTPTPSPTPSVAGITSQERRRSADRASAYLQGEQDTNGRIESDLVTAWSAIAFGADNQRAENIQNEGTSLLAGLSLASPSSTTDLERNILAIRASGANAYAFYGHNYVNDLLGTYDNGQFGSPSFINDDVFAILALMAVNEDTNRVEVRKTIETILKSQHKDGSWEGGIDMTAAAMQALRAYQNAGGDVDVNGNIQWARGYMKSHQDEYGGFGKNSASTAWGIQAIIALGEDPEQWKVSNGSTPLSALVRYQNANGGFGWKSSDDVSAFMTAYAVPALLGVPLPVTSLEVRSRIEASSAIQDGGKIEAQAQNAVQRKKQMVAGAFGTQSDMSGGVQNEFASTEDDKENPSFEGQDQGNLLGDLPSSSKVEGIQDVVTPGHADYVFVLAMFGLTNIGIGVSITRIAFKIGNLLL